MRNHQTITFSEWWMWTIEKQIAAVIYRFLCICFFFPACNCESCCLYGSQQTWCISMVMVFIPFLKKRQKKIASMPYFDDELSLLCHEVGIFVAFIHKNPWYYSQTLFLRYFYHSNTTKRPCCGCGRIIFACFFSLSISVLSSFDVYLECNQRFYKLKTQQIKCRRFCRMLYICTSS